MTGRSTGKRICAAHSDCVGSEAKYFDRRAAGYALAEREHPVARSAELLPFLGLCQGDSPALDVFCGTGFLTRALMSRDLNVTPLDLSTCMLQHFQSSGIQPLSFDTVPQLAAQIDKYRSMSVCSLAGLHHCFLPNDLNSANISVTQLEMVLQWSRVAGVGGSVVFADVTDTPGVAEVAASNDILQQKLRWGTIKEQMRSLQSSNEDSDWISRVCRADTLREVADRMGEASELCLKSSPSKWFREVVTPRGRFGHEDRFIRPIPFLEGLSARGVNLGYSEWPTPWMFPSRRSAVWYFSTFFALSERDAEDGMEAFLGIRKMGGNSFAVGWRLGYFWNIPQAIGTGDRQS